MPAWDEVGIARSIGCVLNFPSTPTAPGVIKNILAVNNIAIGEAVGGDSAWLRTIDEALTEAGLKIQSKNPIRDEVWVKLYRLLPTSALATLTMSSAGRRRIGSRTAHDLHRRDEEITALAAAFWLDIAGGLRGADRGAEAAAAPGRPCCRTSRPAAAWRSMPSSPRCRISPRPRRRSRSDARHLDRARPRAGADGRALRQLTASACKKSARPGPRRRALQQFVSALLDEDFLALLHDRGQAPSRPRSSAATIRSVSEIGWVRKIIGSPLENTSARRKCSSNRSRQHEAE